MPTKKPVDPYAAVKKRAATVTWTTPSGTVRTGRVAGMREARGTWVEVNVAAVGKPREIFAVRPKSLRPA